MDHIRLALGSFGVALLALYVFVGVGPISEGLYRIGLWPARTLPEIQEAVSKSLPHDGVVCRKGENGWDYVCDTVQARAPMPVLRRKFGIACGALQPVRYMFEMRADEPTRPQPDERGGFSFRISPMLVLMLFGFLAARRVRSQL